MELKKYLILIIIFSFTKFLYADIIKPAENLSAYDVVKIQLTALKNNNKPNKNTGIEQTWFFAHPENKKFTGPYERFKKMYLYKWQLEKSSIDGCSNCWFTTIVSPPTDSGDII